MVGSSDNASILASTASPLLDGWKAHFSMSAMPVSGSHGTNSFQGWQTTGVPLSLPSACRTLGRAMNESRMRVGLPSLTNRQLRRGIDVLGLVVIAVLIVLRVKGKRAAASPDVRVVTYFEGDQPAPAEEGDLVCVTDVDVAGPIGKVISVRPTQISGMNRWEVVMLLNKRYRPKIPIDAVVRPWPLPYCGTSQESQDTHLGRALRSWEIDTTGCRLVDVAPASPLSELRIEERAVLRNSPHARDWFCDVAVFQPRPWWQKAIDFAVIDIGVIYIELIGGVVTIASGVSMLIVFVHRKTGARKRTIPRLVFRR